MFLFKARAPSCHQEIRLSIDTVLSNLQSRAEHSGCPRNALCRIEGGFPGQSYELYLTISVHFMIIRAYLDWNEVLFAHAYSGKGHFLNLIHIQQQNIGCFIFFLFIFETFSFETLADILLTSLSCFLGGKQMGAGHLPHSAPEKPTSATELLAPQL